MTFPSSLETAQVTGAFLAGEAGFAAPAGRLAFEGEAVGAAGRSGVGLFLFDAAFGRVERAGGGVCGEGGGPGESAGAGGGRVALAAGRARVECTQTGDLAVVGKAVASARLFFEAVDRPDGKIVDVDAAGAFDRDTIRVRERTSRGPAAVEAGFESVDELRRGRAGEGKECAQCEGEERECHVSLEHATCPPLPSSWLSS